MTYSATYDPADNKLRLRCSTRLDAETYTRVKAAGFIWAPKQELFVAPMWTPDREDLLLELAGEIGDEDTSLVDRAEQRADRFHDYSDSRAEDAERARTAVDRICDGIPLGQPILVGHHSERHARKDAEKIENGMRRAVKMWDTAQYWKARAAGAIHAAKYKERPDVRARRIKGLEADRRKQEKAKQEADMWLKLWTACAAEPDAELQKGVALRLANLCWLHLPRKAEDSDKLSHCPTAHDALTNAYPSLYAPRTLQEVFDAAQATYPRVIADCDRWLAHLANRLEYERAMLAESGGPAEQKFEIEVGGRVLVGGEWLLVLRVNRSAGKVSSVTTNARYVAVIGIERVRDYRAPEGEDAAKVRAAMKAPPLCNYPGEGFRHMTKAEYEKDVPKWSDFPKIGLVEKTATTGAHRVRQTRAKEGNGRLFAKDRVFLTDVKRSDPPAIEPAAPLPPREFAASASAPRPCATPEPTAFDAMKESLRAAGVQVVSAPQLFPTPAELAGRMVELAGIAPGEDILEPSAGTGRLLDACFHRNGFGWNGEPGGRLVAVELNCRLAATLRDRYPLADVRQADFLACNGDLGRFDVILMNPPFAHGADIKHIRHALTMLKPGGRLVAICANGPRQQAILKPLVEQAGGDWEPLPADTFEESGTSVNAVLLSLTK